MKNFLMNRFLHSFPKILLFRVTFFVTLIVLFASPSQAATNTSNIASLAQQFQQIYTSLKMHITQLETEFSQGLGASSSDVQKAINSTIGQLGVPDPVSSGKKINVVIGNQKVDISTVDPALQGTNAEHGWHQSYTRGQAQSVLGSDGQKQQYQDAEIVNDALNTSSINSNEAQNDIVTQDILKKIAIQNMTTTTILKSVQQEQQQHTRALAGVNINTADISERLDQQARGQQVQNNSNSLQILESAAFNDGFWISPQN